MSSPVYLVACVSQKLDRRAPAADLYRSDWFCKARTYVEETGERWYVLSAAHGLVEPTKRLAPYDATLRHLTAPERRLWGEKTIGQLCRAIGLRHAGPIVFLAGRLYREPLLGFAGERAVIPMLGMGIGQQKAWLASQIIERRLLAAHQTPGESRGGQDRKSPCFQLMDHGATSPPTLRARCAPTPGIET